MAPRGKRLGPTEKEKDAAKDLQETEDPLQAVVRQTYFCTSRDMLTTCRFLQTPSKHASLPLHWTSLECVRDHITILGQLLM